MSVREYIGARYVPLFMGEWDDDNTYEPLSIVMHEGNSYTSRQFVPAGVAITNNAYWAETGNYNAQVEQYRQEVRQLAELQPINVLQFGVDNTGHEPCSDIINELTQQFPLYFPAGEYLIDKQLNLGYSIFGDVDTRQANSKNTYFISSIEAETGTDAAVIYTSADSAPVWRGITIENIVIKCHSGECGIYLTAPNAINNIKGCFIFDVKTRGIFIAPTQRKSRYIVIQDCSILHKAGEGYRSSIGIDISPNAVDSRILNVEVMRFYYGIIIGDFAMLSNCHVWCGNETEFVQHPEYFTGSQAFRFNGSAMAENIYPDTAHNLIYVRNSSQVIIKNVFAYYDDRIINYPNKLSAVHVENDSILDINGFNLCDVDGHVTSLAANNTVTPSAIDANNIKLDHFILQTPNEYLRAMICPTEYKNYRIAGMQQNTWTCIAAIIFAGTASYQLHNAFYAFDVNSTDNAAQEHVRIKKTADVWSVDKTNESGTRLALRYTLGETSAGETIVYIYAQNAAVNVVSTHDTVNQRMVPIDRYLNADGTAKTLRTTTAGDSMEVVNG